MLTMGVVKNIIPAVASTNALVSAVCVSEALKILTYASQQLNTYMMYMGTHGVYAHTFEYGRKPDCPVCSSTSQKMTVDRTSSLEARRPPRARFSPRSVEGVLGGRAVTSAHAAAARSHSDAAAAPRWHLRMPRQRGHISACRGCAVTSASRGMR